MQLKASAGRIQISTYSNGHPMFLTVSVDGNVISEGLHLTHHDLKDIDHCIQRITAAVRHALGPNYAHEVD